MRGWRIVSNVQRALLLMLAACSLVGACSGAKPTGRSPGITLVAPEDRVEISSFMGETLDGTRIDIDDYRGKTIVVNWWGSWCAPCRKEAPAFREVSAEAGADVAFVGLLARDTRANARAFNRRFDITYPTLMDTDSSIALRFAQILPIQAVPGTWILDGQGRIAARIATVDITAGLLRGVIEEVQSSGRPHEGATENPSG